MQSRWQSATYLFSAAQSLAWLATLNFSRVQIHGENSLTLFLGTLDADLYRPSAIGKDLAPVTPGTQI